MRKFITMVGIVAAFAAMTAASASATTGAAMLKTAGTIGTGSNTGAISGNATSYGTHIFTASGAQVKCNDATFRITSVATTAATIDASYASCGFFAPLLLGAATVDVNCDWSLSFASATFTDTTGAGSGGSVTTNCATTVTIPALKCTIHVFGQTRTGISSQNIDAAGNNSTSATPWGSKIIANVTGLTYTTSTHGAGNCVIPEHGTGTYAGTVAVQNVWGSL